MMALHRRDRLLLFCALLFAAPTVPCSASAKRRQVLIHVAPDDLTRPDTSGASLASDGSADRPFVSLHAAQSEVRRLLANATGTTSSNIEVLVHPGQYELDRPLRFTSADSGRGVGVVWRKHGPASAEARVLGGRVLGAWQRAWGEVYRTRLGRRIYGLSENGRQGNPARHPNTNPGAGAGWLGGASNSGFSWAEGSLPPNISTFGLGNTSMVMTSGHNYYWSETWAVESFNLSSRTGTFRQDPDKSASNMPAGPHCYLFGSAGLIDEPGEWALDAEGEWLYYWPRSGLPIEALEIVAPISQRPLQIVGESFVEGQVVSGLSFVGLSFIGSDGADSWYLSNHTECNSVPPAMRQGMIFMENASNIEIIGCKIHSTAASGIWLNYAVDSVTIKGNWFEDIGYCGIFAYGFWPGAPESYVQGPNTTAMDTYINRNHTIDSNVIRNVGTMNFGAAGIWLFQSGNNTVSRNLINRGPRNAVGLFGPHYVCLSVVNYSKYRTAAATAFNKALGGSDHGLYDIPIWGFDSMFPVNHARNNTIIYNDFSNLVRDSCDPGLVESYGVGKGQRVIANAIHDVSIPPKRWGRPNEAESMGVQILFSDAQTHFSEYRSNVLYEIDACSGGNGAMVKNWQEIFENNVMADSSLGGAIWMGAYAGPVAQMIVRHNVFGNTTGYCGLTGNPNSLWPGDTNNHFTPPPGAPPGVGKPSGHIAVGESGNIIGGNASMTCYHANCNTGWGRPHCPECTYRLSTEEMALPMIEELDWNLVDQPLNPNVSISPPRGLGFQQHSRFADPGFQRTNLPWATNWTDFVVSNAAAQSVRHMPIDLSKIGLGDDFAFEPRLVGRRFLFREGDPTAELGEKQHFEDEDRVRGLVKAPSAGLLSVPPGGAWPHGGFPAAPGAWAVYKNRVFNSGGATTATVIIRAHVAGQCVVAPSPSPTSCNPSKPPTKHADKHRFWRVDARPGYFENLGPWTWDVCSLDFFSSDDGTGPSLLPADKSVAQIIASKGGAWPSAPTCNRGNVSSWAGIHGGMNSKIENYLGWDFGNQNVSVRSVKIKQFDTQYCARTLAIQWSDDGHCFYDAWFVNASADCPFNTTAMGGHAGVTTSPPSVEPTPSPAGPPHDHGTTTGTSLNITFTLGGPLSAGSMAQSLGSVQMVKGRPVVNEGMATADGNAAGFCDYVGTLSLQAQQHDLADDGGAHDLYLSFEAGANATFLLDSFWMRADRSF